MKEFKYKDLISLNASLLLLLIVILVMLTAGFTYSNVIPEGTSWFTAKAGPFVNRFIAGTVLIDAEMVEYSHNSATSWNPEDDCLQIKYEIDNEGSKSIYARTRFEAYWDKIYHKNTVTVTAEYGAQGLTESDSDVAHFYYERDDESIAEGGNTNTAGFTAKDYSLPPLNVAIDNPKGNGGNSGNNDGNGNGNGDECAAVEPIEYDKDHPFWDDAKNSTDPIPPSLPFPDQCTTRYFFKIDDGYGEDEDFDFGLYGTSDDTINDDVTVEKYILNDTTGEWEVSDDKTTTFEVFISDLGDKTFKFEANQPVFHVYVKGGSGGNLYPYYYPDGDEKYPDGVTQGCDLRQPAGDGGWSHIVFYYCDSLEPGIEITKSVYVGGDEDEPDSWRNANDEPGPKLEPGITPKFRFEVTNTGDILLTNIEVTDDVFDLSGFTIPDLAPGVTEIFEIEYSAWTDVLSTESIDVELCNKMTDWVPDGKQPLGTYFYYTQVIDSQDETIPLCVNICFDDSEHLYDGSELVIYSYFEAVQSTHGIINDNWTEDDMGWQNP